MGSQNTQFSYKCKVLNTSRWKQLEQELKSCKQLLFWHNMNLAKSSKKFLCTLTDYTDSWIRLCSWTCAMNTPALPFISLLILHTWLELLRLRRLYKDTEHSCKQWLKTFQPAIAMLLYNSVSVFINLCFVFFCFFLDFNYCFAWDILFADHLTLCLFIDYVLCLIYWICLPALFAQSSTELHPHPFVCLYQSLYLYNLFSFLPMLVMCSTNTFLVTVICFYGEYGQCHYDFDLFAYSPKPSRISQKAVERIFIWTERQRKMKEEFWSQLIPLHAE